MIQAAVPMCFGTGAAYCLSHAEHIRQRDPFGGVGQGLRVVVAYTGLGVTPILATMVWLHPAWESMYVESRPSWQLVMLACAAVNVAAVSGFVITRALLAWARVGAACAQWHAAVFATAFVAVFGWDGSGFRRFFSADSAALANWGREPLTAHAIALAQTPLAWQEAVLTPLTAAIFVVIAGRCGSGAQTSCPTWEHARRITRPLANVAFAGCVAAAVTASVLGWLLDWWGLALWLGTVIGVMRWRGLPTWWYLPLSATTRPAAPVGAQPAGVVP